MHVPVQKIILTQSYDAKILPADPTLTPGAGSKTEVGPSIPIYIYIYIYIYTVRIGYRVTGYNDLPDIMI